MSENSPPSQRHIAALDGVRGLAILGVLLAHSVDMITWVLSGTLQNRVNGMAEVGTFGVDLFFVLSGFLITGILLDTKESSHYFRNFYAKRFLRLFPVYYGYLLFTATIMPAVIRLGHSSLSHYTGSWWWYLLYISNWKSGNGAHDPGLGQFWSLAVEEQFYLVWPSVVLLLSRRKLAIFCGLLIAFAFTLRCVLSDADVYWNVIYRLTVTRLDTLAFGALVALAMRSEIWKERVRRWTIPAGLGAFVCFFGIALYVQSFSWTEQLIQTVGALAAAAGMAALVAYCAMWQRGILIRVLRSRFLRAYGRYSYGMYVYHGVVFTVCAIPELRLLRYKPELGLVVAAPMFLIAQVAVFCTAKLSWTYFESPILRYKAKFTNSRSVQAQEQQAAAEEHHRLPTRVH